MTHSRDAEDGGEELLMQASTHLTRAGKVLFATAGPLSAKLGRAIPDFPALEGDGDDDEEEGASAGKGKGKGKGKAPASKDDVGVTGETVEEVKLAWAEDIRAAKGELSAEETDLENLVFSIVGIMDKVADTRNMSKLGAKDTVAAAAEAGAAAAGGAQGGAAGSGSLSGFGAPTLGGGGAEQSGFGAPTLGFNGFGAASSASAVSAPPTNLMQVRKKAQAGAPAAEDMEGGDEDDMVKVVAAPAQDKKRLAADMVADPPAKKQAVEQ
jgi:hypothetical protein